MSDDLDCERMERPEGRTLVLRGEIDLATVDLLNAHLRALADEAHSPALVDLSGVTFINSTGINALIVQAQSMPEGTSLVLVDPSPACTRVFDLLGLNTVFDIRST